MTKKPPPTAVRMAYLRFKLEMLDKWIHQLNVERRYTDSEYRKLANKRSYDIGQRS